MGENQTEDISEKELVKLLEAMPDNIIVRVVFGEEERDGEGE